MRFLEDSRFVDAAASLASVIAERGGRLYLVGGGVRDRIMCRPVHDFDLCITGLAEAEVRDLLPEAKESGLQFPVFRAPVGDTVCEIALARRERKEGEGHRGFSVWADQTVMIKEDLERRDLTVNAIAYDLLAGVVIDPFFGQADIESRSLRAVSGAFIEDPLRVYRVARFAATLGFTVECGTIETMRRLVPELDSLSTERVVIEFEKAMSAEQPSMFFRVLADASALSVHFKEIDALRGVEQPKEHHPEGDVFEHSMQVLDVAAEESDSFAVRFAALVHDLGKAATPHEEWPLHRGHDLRGVPLVAALGERLGLARRLVRAGQVAARRHMALHNLTEMRGVKIVDILTEASRSMLGVEGLAIVVDADSRGRGAMGRPSPSVGLIVKAEAARTAVRSEEIEAPPGRKFGEALRSARGTAVKAAMLPVR